MIHSTYNENNDDFSDRGKGRGRGDFDGRRGGRSRRGRGSDRGYTRIKAPSPAVNIGTINFNRKGNEMDNMPELELIAIDETVENVPVNANIIPLNDELV